MMTTTMKYEFLCLDCNKQFDKEMSLEMYNTYNVLFCPYCGSVLIKRVINSVPAVVYKGSGFTKKVKDDTDS